MLARSILHLSRECHLLQRTRYALSAWLHLRQGYPCRNQQVQIIPKFQCEKSTLPLKFFGAKCFSSKISHEDKHDSDESHVEESLTGESVTESPSSGASRKTAVFMRGLPYAATHEDIIKFFSTVNIKPCHITLKCNSLGQPNGVAEVEFKTEEEVAQALTRHNAFIGHRYVEISTLPYPAVDSDQRVFKKRSLSRTTKFSGFDMTTDRSPGYWVRLSGLPYTVTSDDIYQFFRPLKISPIAVELKHNAQGYPNGLCNVKFQTQNEALEALKNNNCYIGNRYIKVSLSGGSLRQVPSSYNISDELAGS